MALDARYNPKVTSISATGKMATCMVKGLTLILMVRSIRASGKMTNTMAAVLRCGKTAPATRVNISTARNMEKGNSGGKMAALSMVTSLITRWRAKGCMFGKTVEGTLAIGKVT